MSVAVTARGTTWNTTAGDKTVVATPAAGDLIVVIAASTGVATTAVVDTQSGTYTQVGSTRTGFSTTGNLTAWVRTALIPAASSTTWTATQTSSTGGGLTVLSLSGMIALGAAAVRSSGGQSTGTAATTPAPVLSLTPLSTNPIITAVANGTNGSTTVTPRTGYTEDTDLGYNTPATGLEVAHLVSGETSATLTHGSTTASAFASIALEMVAPIIGIVTQPATARIANNPTKTQTATAKIAAPVSKTQGALSRISVTLTKTQTATASIIAVVTKTQSATARVLGTTVYSYGTYSSLPTGNTPLTHIYSNTEIANVATVDSVFVDATINNTYGVHMFANKGVNNTGTISPTWTGRIGNAASSRNVVLQIYNFTSGLWETLATNSVAAAGATITLNGTQSTGLSNYYGSGNYVYIRVYQ